MLLDSLLEVVQLLLDLLTLLLAVDLVASQGGIGCARFDREGQLGTQTRALGGKGHRVRGARESELRVLLDIAQDLGLLRRRQAWTKIGWRASLEL